MGLLGALIPHFRIGFWVPVEIVSTPTKIEDFKASDYGIFRISKICTLIFFQGYCVTPLSLNVNNFNIRKIIFEILNKQSPVALFRCWFTA